MMIDEKSILHVRKFHYNGSYPVPGFEIGSSFCAEGLEDSIRLTQHTEGDATSLPILKTRYYSTNDTGVSIRIPYKCYQAFEWEPGQIFLTMSYGDKKGEFILTRSTDEEIAAFARKQPEKAKSGHVRNNALYLSKEERTFLALPPVDTRKQNSAWVKVTEWIDGDAAFLRVEPVREENAELPQRSDLYRLFGFKGFYDVSRVYRYYYRQSILLSAAFLKKCPFCIDGWLSAKRDGESLLFSTKGGHPEPVQDTGSLEDSPQPTETARRSTVPTGGLFKKNVMVHFNELRSSGVLDPDKIYQVEAVPGVIRFTPFDPDAFKSSNGLVKPSPSGVITLPDNVTATARFVQHQYVSITHTPKHCFLVADGYVLRPSAFEDVDGQVAVFLQHTPSYSLLAEKAEHFEREVSLSRVSLADFFTTLFDRQKSAGVLCSLFCEDTGHTWMEVRKCPTIAQIPTRNYVERHYRLPLQPELSGITYFDRLNGKVLNLPSMVSGNTEASKFSLWYNNYEGCAVVELQAPTPAGEVR